MEKKIVKINDLHEHMNLSYRSIKDNIYSINLQRSLLNGTSVCCETIQNCNFQFTEWSGSRVTKTRINGSDFKFSEIKSVWFQDCLIVNCDFNDAIISDCTFNNCSFINCKYKGTFFQENTYNNCTIKDLIFTEASSSLNLFNDCTFENVDICGSFYYSIFNNCYISRCRIDEYLLGYILGFFSSKIENINYLKAGESFNVALEVLVDDLIQQYEERFKFVNIAILRLNLNESNNIDKLLLACIKAFVVCFHKDISISLDDIKFINYIIDIYYKNHAISPCMIFEAVSLVKNALDNKSSDSNVKQLKQLYSCLFCCQQDYLMSSKIELDIEPAAQYILYIKYNKEPAINIINLINSLSPDHVINPTIIKTAKGSFLQWLSCDGNAALMVSILFGFLNITTPIVYDVIKEKIKRHKKINEKETLNNTITKISKNNNIINSNINSNNSILNNCNIVINTVNNYNLSVENEYQGYNNSNIREIKITKNN